MQFHISLGVSEPCETMRGIDPVRIRCDEDDSAQPLEHLGVEDITHHLGGITARAILGQNEYVAKVAERCHVGHDAGKADLAPAQIGPDAKRPVNRALDGLRQQKASASDGSALTTERSDTLDEVIAGDERDPAESALLSEQAKLLAVCMSRLDASQRQAVALAYLRDQSHSEIAEQLSVPLGTIKSWVRRGLEKLKICMGGK